MPAHRHPDPLAPGLPQAVVATLALLLAACSSDREPPAVAEGAGHVDCAVGGTSDFKPVCSLERIEADGRTTMIVRHPDGAFRRFEVSDDGEGLVPSDGAETATTSLADGKLVVTLGADRYRFPVPEQADAPH
ncbi:hypothetical protein [Novosphingobium sp. BL-52-GroH]|uniref:hypothetical protein n=1 Tax=Novosphingobium sp. BL-52-GroH TaxID=3349877 RepID=UPI00384D49A7